MGIMTKVLGLLEKLAIPHTRLPGVFMKKNSAGLDVEPLDFVGSEYRKDNASGFTDDRVRNENDYVVYAPRKVRADLLGGGILVSENYPQSVARGLDPETVEANTPRQTRGVKADTLTNVHDARQTFDVSVSTFEDTLDDTPPPDDPAAWDGKANPTTTQPENPFNAKYPYNHVRETESGHLFEADDTPGAERIKEAHRSGTYYEVFPEGSKVEKIVRDNFTVIVGNDRVNIEGSAIVTIEGDCNFYTKGNFTHQVNGDYNLLVKGTYTAEIADDMTIDSHSDYYHYVGHQIDPAKGVEGRGNKGGESKTDVAGDYQLHITGVTSEIYGDKELFDKYKAGTLSRDLGTTQRQTVLYGDETNQVMDGFKYDHVEANRTEIIGGNHTVNVQEDEYEHIVGKKTILVDKTSFAESIENTTIVGSTIDLNP